jgi:hypothetical protein
LLIVKPDPGNSSEYSKTFLVLSIENQEEQISEHRMLPRELTGSSELPCWGSQHEDAFSLPASKTVRKYTDVSASFFAPPERLSLRPQTKKEHFRGVGTIQVFQAEESGSNSNRFARKSVYTFGLRFAGRCERLAT